MGRCKSDQAGKTTVNGALMLGQELKRRDGERETLRLCALLKRRDGEKTVVGGGGGGGGAFASGGA